MSALSVEVEEGEQDGEAALKMQCELLLTVRMNAGTALDVVSDAYIAGDGTFSLEREEMALCGAAETVQASVPFRGTLLLDENAPGAGTALAARVRPVVSEITDEQDGAHIRGLLEATALYMPSGSERLSGARGDEADGEALDQMSDELLRGAMGEMIVTPREVDDLVHQAALMLSGGVNRALHPDLSDLEIARMMS